MESHALHRLVLSLSLVLSLATAPVSAQQTQPAGAKAQNAAHDLSGIWVKPGEGARYRPGGKEAAVKREEGKWDSRTLPYTAEGRKVFDERRPTAGPRQVKSQMATNDPRDQGNPLGLYRTLAFSGGGRSFEMAHLPGKIVQLFSVGRVWRTIYLNRPAPEEITAGPFWFGKSVGHWDGDTLVVNTFSLDGRQWFDNLGTPISDEARIEERWTRSGDRIHVTITVNDPVYYTKPWAGPPMDFIIEKRGEPEEIIAAPIDMTEYVNTTLAPSAEKK